MATTMHLIIRIVVYFLRDSKACMGGISMRKYTAPFEKMNFHLPQIFAVILNYAIKDGLA
jgi:hypothetical protein